ncbi:serine hydrolase [Streptomyces sp. HUAS TT3]|uniref:serine hydrolase domain-containing protein n=1 Tax=Streptomyces sp. HUAS TT3 TaxID=3447510 RepID=UPI003F658A7C
MNRRTRTVLAAALLLGLTAGPLGVTAHAAPAAVTTQGPDTAATTQGPDTAALRKALAGLPDQDATAALIRVGGNGRWTGTAGVRDLRTGAPALADARFRAGSTTKVVTAALVLQLAAEGQVDLNAPARRYLPDVLPAAFDQVTVRNLLNFTSGIQPGVDFGDTVEEGYPHRYETIPPQQVVASAVAKGPAFTPGTRQDYGNIGYTILGMLIEKTTGDTYAHQAEARIFRPLGMTGTSFPQGTDPRIHGPHNRGYDLMDGKPVDVTEWNMSDRFAAGDMISTTRDLERFLVALFRGQVVPEPQLTEMFTVPDVPGATYAAALQRYEVNGKEIWGKTGARPGYHTVIAATRDLSRTVVYSVNSTDAKGDGLKIAQRFAFPAFNR